MIAEVSFPFSNSTITKKKSLSLKKSEKKHHKQISPSEFIAKNSKIANAFPQFEQNDDFFRLQYVQSFPSINAYVTFRPFMHLIYINDHHRHLFSYSTLSAYEKFEKK